VLPYDPGRKLAVNVSVTPADQGGGRAWDD
jgi:hypothetical protein